MIIPSAITDKPKTEISLIVLIVETPSFIVDNFIFIIFIETVNIMMFIRLRSSQMVLSVAIAVGLSACASTENAAPVYHQATPSYQQTAPQTVLRPAQNYALASSHWSDVAKLRAEAERLGTQVSAGRMTKVQAAQHLNKYRISTIGQNSVDDSVYEVYLRAAVDSQRGVITSAQSKSYVENALRGWQQRWDNMSQRPTNPAFTNFLLEFMGMKPLK